MENQKILSERRKSTGVISLNRPRALNALDQDMVDAITVLLAEWQDDPGITQVLVRSTSPKAFCAGGDVRYGYSTAAAGDVEVSEYFFTSSYDMHGQVSDFDKPYVSVIDGLAMGGGLGLSVNGSVRVVTENATAAMPELAIGYLPDVGMTLVMQEVRGEKGYQSAAVATFVGLSGWRLNAADMLWMGLATHHVPAEHIDDFEESVVADGAETALARYGRELKQESRLEAFCADIEACFGYDTWGEIDRALNEHDNDDFVRLVREGMSGASPMSVVASVEVFRANAGADSTREALARENAVGELLRKDPNFAEGIRAVILDKDRSPSFIPALAADVDPEPFRRALARATRPLRL